MSVVFSTIGPTPQEHDSPVAYSTGAELKESIVLDSALCTADVLSNKRYRYGTPLGQVTVTRNHSYWNPAAADGRETLTGILVNTTDVTRGNAPGAQYTAFAVFETTRLLAYAGNQAAFTAALPQCLFRTLSKRNPSP
jgi:hypothetical protein